MSSTLFQPYPLGRITLRNRVVMAPMTRSRSPGNLPGPLVATYYAQRATAGLIIAEGTAPAPEGLGYTRIPGLFNTAQAAAWRAVTDAVHAQGGHIYVQLMHTGRVGHPLNLPAGARLLAPSPVAAPGTMWTDTAGAQAHPVPTEMTEADIADAIAAYAASARLAVEEAGFDGVELHAANGYLVEQFLNVATNHRTDRWGGSLENRARFALAVVDAIVAAIGADRLGVRISPFGVFNGSVADPDTEALYLHLAAAFSARGLAYLHLVDHAAMGAPALPPHLQPALRAAFQGTFILSGGYDRDRAEADLAAHKGDLVAIGRPFLSNPDLVARMAQGLPLAPVDYGTLYTPGAAGYTDYPTAT